MAKGLLSIATLASSLLQDPACAAQDAALPANTNQYPLQLAGEVISGGKFSSEFLALEDRSLTNQAAAPQLKIISQITEAAKSNIVQIYSSPRLALIESRGYEKCSDINSLAANEQSIHSLEKFVGTDLLQLSRRLAELQISAACAYSDFKPDARSLTIVQHSLALDFGVQVAGSNTFTMPTSWTNFPQHNRQVDAPQSNSVATSLDVTNSIPSPGAMRFAQMKSSGIPISEEVICNGNPNVGRAKIIYNMHGSDQNLDILRDYEVLSQREVWRQLENEKCKHIFPEGLAYTLGPGDTKRGVYLLPDEVRSAFPKGFQQEFTDEQADLLHWLGADRVYAALHPDVTLHRTMTVEERDFIKNRPRPTSENLEEWSLVTQPYAMRELAEFFKSNPGEKAIVVFGSKHRFRQEDFPAHSGIPTVTGVRFPEFERNNPIRVSYQLIDISDPEKQLAIVREAHTILPFGFQVLWSEAGQLEALPKLTRNNQSKAEAYRFLRAQSISTNVMSKVDDLYRSGAGPFKEYRKPQNW